MTGKLQPLAIMGGTFDPVHYGHLRCAEEARRKLGLDSVSLLPAARPPHRQAPVASIGQRLAMLRHALGEFQHLVIDDRETRRGGPSYMVDTLLDLRAESPARPVLLLLGQDAANGLHAWHRWRQLFSLAHVVILGRPGANRRYDPRVAREIERRVSSDAGELQDSEAGRVLYLEVGHWEISATVIKKMIRRGETPDGMMPAAVLRYIREQGLYAGA